MPASDTGPSRSAPAPSAFSGTPDGSITHAPASHCAIQIGLSGEAVDRFLDQWTTAITDVTSLAVNIHRLVSSCDHAARKQKSPMNRLTRSPTTLPG